MPQNRFRQTIESLERRVLLTIVTVTPAAGASEGDGDVAFTATLDAISISDVTVSYRTANGSARAGADFVAAQSSVVIPAGQTAATFAVSLVDDDLYEPGEAFALNLKATSPAGKVQVLRRRVDVSVADDEAVPTLFMPSEFTREGDAGEAIDLLTRVVLSGRVASPVRIAYRMVDDSATAAGRDYRAKRGSLTIRPGEWNARFLVRVLGDDLAEGEESFRVELTPAAASGLAPTSGTVKIFADADTIAPPNEPVPFLSIAGPTARAEGNGDDPLLSAAVFVVTLAAPSASSLPTTPVTVAYTTLDGSATAGDGDYEPRTGVLTFAPGETVKTIGVPTGGDTKAELDETFSLVLSSPSGATFTTGTASATLLNDDEAPANPPPAPPPPPPVVPNMTIEPASIVEGNLIPGLPDPVPATATLLVPVTLSVGTSVPVTVRYQTGSTGTGDGHATAGFDYSAVQGDLTFVPTETLKFISIAVPGDIEIELDETFTVTLFDAAGATITTASIIATIFNDDFPPM